MSLLDENKKRGSDFDETQALIHPVSGRDSRTNVQMPPPLRRSGRINASKLTEGPINSDATPSLEAIQPTDVSKKRNKRSLKEMKTDGSKKQNNTNSDSNTPKRPKKRKRITIAKTSKRSKKINKTGTIVPETENVLKNPELKELYDQPTFTSPSPLQSDGTTEDADDQQGTIVPETEDVLKNPELKELFDQPTFTSPSPLQSDGTTEDADDQQGTNVRATEVVWKNPELKKLFDKDNILCIVEEKHWDRVTEIMKLRRIIKLLTNYVFIDPETEDADDQQGTIVSETEVVWKNPELKKLFDQDDILRIQEEKHWDRVTAIMKLRRIIKKELANKICH